MLRDVVRSFSWQLETLLASVIGWLTVASWLQGDRSPLETLDRVADWLGVDISNWLTNTDAWLNADHRHAALIVACQILFWAALLAHANRLWEYWPAREATEKRGARQIYVRGSLGAKSGSGRSHGASLASLPYSESARGAARLPISP
jgi:hypothetical protein